MNNPTIDYVAHCRGCRQRAVARAERLSKMRVPLEHEAERLQTISENQEFIAQIDSELDRYERELGWRT